MNAAEVRGYQNTVGNILFISEYLKNKASKKIDGTTTSDGRPIARKAEAFTDEQVAMIIDYFLNGSQRHKYRNHLLFVFGINNGRRMGDVLNLKLGQVFNGKRVLPGTTIRESKTGKLKDLHFNAHVVDAIELYLCTLDLDNIDLENDYLFKSQKVQKSKIYKSKIEKNSSEGGGGTEVFHSNPYEGEYVLRVDTVFKILNEAGRALGIDLDVHIGTHSLRKTYSEKFLDSVPNASEALPLLQNDLGHERSSTTLKYLGRLEKKRKDVIMNLQWT